MKIKKLLAILLSFILIMNFTSCGKDDKTDTTTKENKTTTESTEETKESTEPDTTDEAETTEKATDETEPPKAPQKPDDTEPDGITPLLYKVTDADGNIVWLFGSIHVGMDYFYPLPDYVMNAYNSSDALAVEFDITNTDYDMSSLMSVMMEMAYTDGTKLKDHIPEDIYEDSKAILKENGMYFPALDIYYPILWSMFIDSIITEDLGYNSELGIDYFFLNTAHEENKKIYDVESMEFQLGMLAGFSDDLQLMMLESSIDSYNNIAEYKESLDELATGWAKGDASALTDEDYEFDSKKEQLLYEEYNTEMVVKRNINMADFAEDALESGEEVFIVVGAAHVVGDGGMADLLAERGYTVEIVK